MSRVVFAAILGALCCSAVRAEGPTSNTGGSTGATTQSAMGDPTVLLEGRAGKPILQVWGTNKEQYIKGLERVITLTDQQKQTMAEIFADRDRQLAEYKAKISNKAEGLIEARRAAMKSGDKEAIAQAEATYQEMYGPIQDLLKKADERLRKVVTREQWEQLREDQLTATIKVSVQPAELTEDQISRIKAAMKQGNLNVEQATQLALTPTQKLLVRKTRALIAVRYRLGSAKLTQDQWQKVDSSAQKLAGDESLSKEELAEKLTEHATGLLTPDQKALYEKQRRPVYP